MMDDRRGFVCMCAFKRDSPCIILSDTLPAGRKQGMMMDGGKEVNSLHALPHANTQIKSWPDPSREG